MARKLAVLKPQKFKNLNIFLSLSYYSFEDKVTNFERDMIRKRSLINKQKDKKIS